MGALSLLFFGLALVGIVNGAVLAAVLGLVVGSICAANALQRERPPGWWKESR